MIFVSTVKVRRVVILFYVCLTLLLSSSCLQRETLLSSPNPKNAQALDLNAASQKELEQLPGIGDDLARRIIEYRSQNNGFQCTEELLLLRGMSEEKFRVVQPLTKAE